MSKNTMPPPEYRAMMQLLKPMIKAAGKMSGPELALAMKGFYAASESNCAWYAYALRHAMPPVLAVLGDHKEGFTEAWFPAQAIEARSGETAGGLDPKDESAVGVTDAPEGGQ